MLDEANIHVLRALLQKDISAKLRSWVAVELRRIELRIHHNADDDYDERADNLHRVSTRKWNQLSEEEQKLVNSVY